MVRPRTKLIQYLGKLTNVNIILYPVPVQQNSSLEILYPVPVGKTSIRLYPWKWKCFSMCAHIDQRCRGRNYPPGRRCCTPEDPCDVGEGDCDGRGDGGLHDGDRGCAGDLVCGSNNCLQFGLYYHQKDDCCEEPTSKKVAEVVGLKSGEA